MVLPILDRRGRTPFCHRLADLWKATGSESIERVPFLFLKRAVDPAAAGAIHEALSDPEIFQSVRWHYPEAFDAGDEESGALNQVPIALSIFASRRNSPPLPAVSG